MTRRESDPLAAAVAAIRAGRLAAMPTETVYGLAGDATRPGTVLAIYERKDRPSFDPLIVHLAAAEAADGVARVSATARALMDRFWPGPLTLVLPRRSAIPDVVTAGLDTVGVRCPDHPLARNLIRRAGRPLAAPSANRFGRVSPTTAAHVHEQFPDADFPIVDGGPCRVGVESTVLALIAEPVVLRPGAVTPAELGTVLGSPPRLAAAADHRVNAPQQAPGRLPSHYAPRTPLVLRLPGAPWPTGTGLGYLAFRGHDLPPAVGPVEVLSPTGDLREAATRLFAALRRLDAAGCVRLIAELVPEEGIGLAIDDRLRRAGVETAS